MAPTRIASTRQKTRSPLFRDDSSLVALRYEKTAAAEPPIPVLPVGRRSTRPRPLSTLASSNKSRWSHQYHHPIVVAPPLPLVQPPTELHPALRTTTTTTVEEWKRDSGVARTNSCATIREPDCETERQFIRVRRVASDAVSSSPVSPTTAPLIEEDEVASALENHFKLRRSSRLTVASAPCTTLVDAPAWSLTLSCSSSGPLSPSSVASAPLPSSPAAPSFRLKRATTTAGTTPEAEVAQPQAAPKVQSKVSLPLPKRLPKASSFQGSSRIPTQSIAETKTGESPATTNTNTSISRARTINKGPTGVQAPMHPRGQLRGAQAQTNAPAQAQAPVLVPDPSTEPAPAPAPAFASLPAYAKATKAKPTPDDCSQIGNPQSEHYSTFSSSPSPASSPVNDVFSPLGIAIPTERIFDDGFMSTVTFSKRGSIMISGRRVSAGLDGSVDRQWEEQPLDQEQHREAQEQEQKQQQGQQQQQQEQEHTQDVLREDEPQELLTKVEANEEETKAPSITNTETAETLTLAPARGQSSIDTVETDDAPATEDASSEPTFQPESPHETEPQSTELMAPPDIRVLAADVEKESQRVRSLYAIGDGLHWEEHTRHSYCERLEPTPEAPSEDNFNDPSHHHLTPVAWETPRSGSSYSRHHDALRREYELAGGIEDWEDIDGASVDRYGFINKPRPSSRVGTPTDLRSSQLSARKRNMLLKRDPSSASAPLAGYRTRPPSRKVSARSLNTVNSEMSITSLRSSRSVIRQASNLLPHNRDRRWMDEAGDMLNFSPGIQDVEDELKAEKLSEAMKHKEWERSEKWRRMAKVVRKGAEGQGMEFEFDAKNQKLIDRTWKGIPDRWRAAAWWSFLASSAKEDLHAATEESIVSEFHKLQQASSPDDLQIDLDVPRTINQHIMFRRRYRGGQRLLFRVLHALSIYFPETGYVQGMASLVATLLCYFDEEKCFVMLVRMWKYRGLELLYRPGFEDLIKQLGVFSELWLNKDVASKMTELGIDPTAYGTRWYLTLFNLSIPFPAQLRIWDIFLLYGDAPASGGEDSQSNYGFEVLHAASAALIQALREVLLDSDFENGMKALTSWIPIQDEDLLMKVTKAEWKIRRNKKKV